MPLSGGTSRSSQRITLAVFPQYGHNGSGIAGFPVGPRMLLATVFLPVSVQQGFETPSAKVMTLHLTDAFPGRTPKRNRECGMLSTLSTDAPHRRTPYFFAGATGGSVAAGGAAGDRIGLNDKVSSSQVKPCGI